MRRSVDGWMGSGNPAVSAAGEAGRIAGSPTPRQAGWFMGIQLFFLVITEKLGLPAGGDAIPLTLPALLVGLGLLAAKGWLRIDPVRLCAFTAFLFLVIVSQLLSGAPFSPTSVILMLIVYAPMMFVWPLERPAYLSALRVYQGFALFIGGIVALQILTQTVLHVRLTIEPFLPPALMLKGYMYEGALTWGHEFYRPNGLFLLETSFAALFLGTGLLVETLLFRRLLVGGFLLLATIGTLGATGLVLIVVGLPFVIIRYPKFLPLLLIVAAILTVVAVPLGLLDTILGRFSELGKAGSSGSGRLLQPLEILEAAVTRPGALFAGRGAGNVDFANASVWPVARLVSEYSVMAAIAYFAMLIAAVRQSGVLYPLAIALLVILNFTGGYLHSTVGMNFLILSVVLPILAPLSQSAHPPAPYVHARPDLPLNRT